MTGPATRGGGVAGPTGPDLRELRQDDEFVELLRRREVPDHDRVALLLRALLAEVDALRPGHRRTAE